MKQLAAAMEKVVTLTAVQTTTAVKVIRNLKAEVALAVQNEKNHQIQEAAKSYGVSCQDLVHLKGKLTPTLPYIFRMLDLTSAQLEAEMDVSRRRRMIAATDVLADATEIVRRTTWAGEKNHRYNTSGYVPPTGKYSG